MELPVYLESLFNVNSGSVFSVMSEKVIYEADWTLRLPFLLKHSLKSWVTKSNWIDKISKSLLANLDLTHYVLVLLYT